MDKQKAPRRVQRVEKELRDIISTYMLRDLKGEMQGIATISRVIASRDLKSAKVYVHTLGEAGDDAHNVGVLQEESHPIQRNISKQIRMKYVPKLKFFVDEKFEEMIRVQNLIDQISDQRER